jgi:murein DD-endopeptidase MepM/ murein hydrolase activator NlpD
MTTYRAPVFSRFWRGLVCLFLISACSAQPASPSASNQAKTETPVFIQADPSADAQATPVLQELPEHDSQPLHFTFPTPGQPPVSLWRPPLYDAPWALGPHDHFYFLRPIAADEVNWPLADYRYGGIFPGKDIIHTGIDIDAPRGTPVLASAAGRVVWAGSGQFSGNDVNNDPYGNSVTIRHDFGYQGKILHTVYAHMDRVDVVVGQRVQAGEQLGIVGDTGFATGPHLHFEVRLQATSYFFTRNPELWLVPPQGWGVLVGRLLNTNGSILTGQDVEVESKSNHKVWMIRSYGGSPAVTSDDYYKENLVLSDLPEGDYQLSIDYLETRYKLDFSIHPGAITYFTFKGEKGFNTSPPATPSPESWLKDNTEIQ